MLDLEPYQYRSASCEGLAGKDLKVNYRFCFSKDCIGALPCALCTCWHARLLKTYCLDCSGLELLIACCLPTKDGKDGRQLILGHRLETRTTMSLPAKKVSAVLYCTVNEAARLLWYQFSSVSHLLLIICRLHRHTASAGS